MLCTLTAEKAREANEEAKQAVNEAFRSLPKTMSELYRKPIDVILEDRNGDGARELYLQENKTQYPYGNFVIR